MTTTTIKPIISAKYTAGAKLNNLWINSMGLYINNGKTISIMLIIPQPIAASNFNITAFSLYLKDPDGSWVIGRQSDVTQMVTSTAVYTNYMTVSINSDTVISSAGYCYGQTIISGTFT